MKCVICGESADYTEGGRSVCKICLMAMKSGTSSILSARENAFMAKFKEDNKPKPKRKGK